MFLPSVISAQSITTEPVAAVPVGGPWLMPLLWLTLLLAGMWMLRQGPRQARALILAGLMASGLWMMQAARAQVVDLQFTNAEGETLAIPVNQIVGGSGLEGFQRVDYRNSSAISLRIAAIVEPDFDACFPDGLDEPLPAPDASSGTECSVGLTLGPDETCRVDVDAICRDRADAAEAEITVAPLTVSFVEGGSGEVTITADAGSPVYALDLEATIPGGSAITVQSTTCGASLSPGDSCQITFTGPTVESANVSVGGANTDSATVTVNVTATPLATLSVAPPAVTFVENGTGDVTVTNTSVSVTASNVAATIPGGSDFSVQSTTCGAALAPAASCTITFANAVAEGPTTVSIAGDNTNTANVSLTTTSAPTIAITSPVQQSRVIAVSGGTLSLEVTNDAGSAINATGITVTDKTGAPNVNVDDSDCASVAPGASCTLELSSVTPYAPATITIGGGNTANSPTTLVVFSYLGGLVFEESGGAGKVVIDVAQSFTSAWTAADSNIAGATSPNDGQANTNAIVADVACTINPASCAAQQCRNIGPDWYLPAVNEVAAVQSALCSNAATPCNAGGFAASLYWSSTQTFLSAASSVSFPSGAQVASLKPVALPVRCVRPF